MPASAKVTYDPRKVLDSPEFKVLSQQELDACKPTDNIACFYNQHHDLHMVKKPTPEAEADQVVVAMKAVGICGSDVHFWHHGRIGDGMVVTDECGAGHEGAGEIVEVGPNVTKWKVGDRVALECSVPCGSCKNCLTGRYNACLEDIFFSTPPYHGVMTRYHAHPANWVHRLPDHVSFEEGAACEPLAVALAGIERANLRLGDPVLICGAGPIGLVTLLAARAAGAAPIIITDLSADRLAFAKKICPSVHTVQIQKELDPQAQAAIVKDIAGTDINVSMECTGVESSVSTAIFSMKFGGTVFVIGVGKNYMSLPFMHLSANEIDLKFQFRYANQYPKAIRLIGDGLIDLKPLITHRYPLEKAVEAVHTAADIKQGAIKCQVVN